MKKLILALFACLFLTTFGAAQEDTDFLQDVNFSLDDPDNTAATSPLNNEPFFDPLKKIGPQELYVKNLGGGSNSAVCRLGADPFKLTFVFIPNFNYSIVKDVSYDTVVGELLILSKELLGKDLSLRYYFHDKDMNESLYYSYEKLSFIPKFVFGTLHVDVNKFTYLDANARQTTEVTIPVKKEHLDTPFYVQAFAYDQNTFILSDGYALMVPLEGAFRYLADQNTIALWHFDEGNGNLAQDISNNRHHGQIRGATWSEGFRGKGLYFDGIDDYVLVPHHTMFNTPTITIEALVKIDSVKNNSPTDIVVGKSSQWVFGIGDRILTQKVAFGFAKQPLGCTSGTGWCDGGGPLRLGEWYDIAVQYDGNKMKTYINGKLASEYTTRFTPGTSPDSIGIGAIPSGSALYSFHGTIDEVRISKIARY